MPTPAPFQHPADGFYMIEPKGNHRNAGAGVVQVIDDAAIQSIVNRFNAEADAGDLSHGDSMLVDHEHFKHDPEKSTVAYGWLTKLAARPDGIYGQIRWTNTGKAAIDGGDYRFFSTEYNGSDAEKLGGDRVRPLRLDGLTLTNMPNNKGGKPITNRGGNGNTQSVVNRDGALAMLGYLARRLANRYKLNAEQAMELARLENFALYAASIGETPERIADQNGGAEWLINRKFYAAARRTQLEQNTTFQDAYNRTARVFPAMMDMIANRATSVRAILNRWDFVEMSRGEISTAMRGEMTLLERDSARAYLSFLAELENKAREIQREEGLPWDKALAMAKTDNPDLWKKMLEGSDYEPQYPPRPWDGRAA